MREICSMAPSDVMASRPALEPASWPSVLTVASRTMPSWPEACSTSSTISTASLAAGSTVRPPISTRRPIECTPAASCVGCATPDSLSSATAFEMAAMMAGALPLFTTPSIIM